MAWKFGSFHEQSTPRKVLNIVGLAVACLIFLELFLRLAGWLVSFQLLPTEQRGQSAARDLITIACIGDSWTAGQPDGNYPDELQLLLDKTSPNSESAPQYQVINLGFGGANSSQGIRRLLTALSEYAPDIVIVMAGNNDHWNLSESAYWQFSQDEMSALDSMLAKGRVFLHSLRVYKLGTILLGMLRGQPGPNEFYYVDSETPDTLPERAVIDPEIHDRQLEYNLLTYIELARTYHFSLIFQTYFHFHGYRVNETIRNVGLTYHIPVVDNNILFHRQIPVEQRDQYLIEDGHPNKAGYHYIAENVLRVLQETVLP